MGILFTTNCTEFGHEINPFDLKSLPIEIKNILKIIGKFTGKATSNFNLKGLHLFLKKQISKI